MIQCATLGIPKGMKKKYEISISVAFCLDVLIRNENITSDQDVRQSLQLIGCYHFFPSAE